MKTRAVSYIYSMTVDVVIQGVWILYYINKEKGDQSLPLLAFRKHVNVIFVTYSEEGKYS